MASVALLPFKDLIDSGSQFLSMELSYKDSKLSPTSLYSILANNKSISTLLKTILMQGTNASLTSISSSTPYVFLKISGSTPKKCLSLSISLGATHRASISVPGEWTPNLYEPNSNILPPQFL